MGMALPNDVSCPFSAHLKLLKFSGSTLGLSLLLTVCTLLVTNDRDPKQSRLLSSAFGRDKKVRNVSV